ncbi:MAG: DNA polymerase [Patescibacteria group bacterium]|nr:DNA polymerase [Patescibacteria group bacterium]
MTAKKRTRAKKGASGEQARLMLLDTHAIIHRAYHALPDLTTSAGEPTGALYGLITMLLKSIADLKPDYIVAARDRAEKTHRHEIFEEYKGTRAKTEEPLVEQLKRAGEVFDAFGIPVLDVAGFEADDVIGTVAEQVGERKDLETVILTGDMDMLQLIQDGRVTVYRLLTGISNMKYYDEDAVRERYGFGPENVTDYKGMCGDPSDNIKGVKGIGEKTATELIQKFGSVENIYKELEKAPDSFAKKGVKPRVAVLLGAGKESALFSKQLATIRRDAPIRFTLPDHPWRMSDHAKGIMAMCERLEFRSLRERVRALAHVESGAPEEREMPAQEVVPDSLREASIALWLLHSDTTNPSLGDILRYAHTEDFEKARAKVFAELKKTGRLPEVYEKIEKPLIPVVERMNEAGILLDTAHLKELAREYGKEVGEIAGRIYGHAGREFNINSPKQLATVLYDELKIVPARQKMTAGGARTTRESELAKLSPAHPIIADVLAYRELQKLLSTYIEKMPAMVAKDGRLHAHFLQAGTTTGRMASQDPNLQNIPIKTAYGRRIREAFAAPRGSVLIALDYSQIELRIAAGLSGDRKLIDVFKEGGDIHVAVASQVFGVPPQKIDYEMRRRAKVINFGILYGMGVNALRVNLGEEVSRADAAAFLAEYFKKFSGLARYIKNTTQEAAKRGYTETLFGRRRYFPGLSSPLPQMRAQAERMAVNAPIQGTQSDIIKLAMVEADRMIEKEGWRDDVRLVLQVHDELVYEAKKSVADAAAAKIRHAMETVVPAKALHGVPIVAEVSIGKNWGEMQRVSRI